MLYDSATTTLAAHALERRGKSFTGKNTTNRRVEINMIARALALTTMTAMAPFALLAQTTGMPASDTLGADDLAGNPTFIGGVANGGGTAHGVW